MKSLFCIFLFHYLLVFASPSDAAVKRQCKDVIVKGKLFVKCKIVEVKDRTVVCTHYPFTDHMGRTTIENVCNYYDKRILAT